MSLDTLRLTAKQANDRWTRRVCPRMSCFAAYRAAIDDRDAELNCFLHVSDDVARSGDGIPIALKDVISTKGIPTTAGSKIPESYVPCST